MAPKATHYVKQIVHKMSNLHSQAQDQIQFGTQTVSEPRPAALSLGIIKDSLLLGELNDNCKT